MVDRSSVRYHPYFYAGAMQDLYNCPDRSVQKWFATLYQNHVLDAEAGQLMGELHNTIPGEPTAVQHLRASTFRAREVTGPSRVEMVARCVQAAKRAAGEAVRHLVWLSLLVEHSLIARRAA